MSPSSLRGFLVILGTVFAVWLASPHACRATDSNHWHVSTYYAANLNDHGPGNRAMWCGDSTLVACAAWDSVGGVCHDMFDDLGWSQPVPDPAVAVAVRVTAALNYDLYDESWDWLELIVKRGDQEEVLVGYTGAATDGIALDQSTLVLPDEFTGVAGDRVQLVLRVRSDPAWDDEDCFAPSHGAAQIDDIGVSFDGTPVTFDDFESGSPRHWWRAEVATGAGDPPSVRHLTAYAAPNPFNPRVSIVFDVPTPGPVTVAIYDAEGRRLRHLLAAVLPAGSGSVVWDGRSAGGVEMASGTYLFRVTAGPQDVAGKLSLVR